MRKTTKSPGEKIVKDIKPATRKAFDEAVKRAGLNDVTPHTLKHTAVTWAFMNGMTLVQAVNFFATSRDTLEDVYRSYSPEARKEAAGVMDHGL